MQTTTNLQINAPQQTLDTQTRTTTPPDDQTVTGRTDATPLMQATIVNLPTPLSTPVHQSASVTQTETNITKPQQTTLPENISEPVPRHNHPWGDT